MVELPTGTVTFLFTDLEVSTRLWEEHPEAMQDALAQHDTLLRDAIESHHGHIVKTTGDGFHAVFTTARDALEAALAAQLALTAEPWEATGPLRVRMGIHTGEAEVRDGDYYGTTLNRAARIMSAGHGGQVLVSRATAEVLGGWLPDRCDLADLGPHHLRDLGRPEGIVQLMHPELPSSFPPLQSLDTYPGNLPPQFTSFVGRAEEMERVEAMLRDARLVTLTGVGGVGKTRLALQVAAEMLPAFRDGAWLCELATAGDADALVQVVAAALNVLPHPSIPLDHRIYDGVRDRCALVVLDNCEHLLDAASQLADGILRACGEVRLIATSREPLDIAGERIVRVRSLPVPDGSATSGTTDATRLFVERAQKAEPDFGVDETGTAIVGEICRRLDGIPLAIELAAARVVAMTPGEIAELLDERFRLLTGGRRTAVERHQTLRATVDWSYSLLTSTERLVFDRLGVFPGSFDAAAARAVARGDAVEDWDVRDALTSLVNKSMVNTTNGPGGTTRYQLLETMRQYARERLDQAGDSDRRRRVHAVHYAELADQAAMAMATGVEFEQLRTHSQYDLDNYRAAVTWALDSERSGDGDIALRIAMALAGADPVARRTAGLIASQERLLERAELTTGELRAGVFTGYANDAYFVRGDIDTALEYAQRAVAENPSGGAIPMMAYAVLSMSTLAGGDFDGARDALLEARRALRAHQETVAHGEAFIEIMLSRVEQSRGDDRRAQLHAEEAVRQARLAQVPHRLTQALNVLAATLRFEDLTAAQRAVEESVAAARADVGSGLGLGNAMMTRAELSDLRAEPTEALRELRAAVVAWGDSVPTSVLLSFCARSCRIFTHAGAPIPAAVVGGVTTMGAYSHLLTASVDRRGLEMLQTTLDELRQQLGDDVYDREAARGAAMSLEETLRFIRVTADHMLAEAFSD